MKLTIETDREDYGRWIAEEPELRSVMACGATQGDTMAKAEALARGLAKRLEDQGTHYLFVYG